MKKVLPLSTKKRDFLDSMGVISMEAIASSYEHSCKHLPGEPDTLRFQKAETHMHTLTILEQHQWRSILRGVTRLLGQLDRDLDTHSGLSLSEYSVLVALAESGESGVRMTQLADISMLSKSRLSHCVDRLVAAGLVTRKRVPGDKRGFAALLTSTGFLRLAASTPAHLTDVHRYLVTKANPAELATMAKIADLMAVIEPEQ